MTEGPKSKRTLLLISAGMMEITWLYVLAYILFLMLKAPLFPIWTTILAFFTPILIHSVLKGRGRRIIIHVILHAFFYLTILLNTLYFYGNWPGPFFNFKWLEMILHHQYGSVGGLAYLLILFCFSFIWISGYKLANRSHDFYQIIVSRFDLGIEVLVFAFIILGIMNLSFPRSEVLITYYFLFSMFAISLAKNLGSSKTKYSHQFTGTSLVLTFILAVSLIGSWVVLFFLPQLSQAAQTGYHVLKIGSKSLVNLLLKIILSLFSGHGNPAVNVSPTFSGGSSRTMIEISKPSWAYLPEWVLTWGEIILFSLLILMPISWLLWSLWEWFSTKTEVDTKRKGFFEELLLWFLHLFSLGKKGFFKMLGFLKNIRRKQETISVLFQKLCRWGRSSGLPRERSKTPQEYGRYLTHFFPDSQPDIQLIIQSFNQEIYGNKSIQAEQWRKAKKAWQRLSSPTKWPLRLRVKIFYSRKFRLQEVTIST